MLGQNISPISVLSFFQIDYMRSIDIPASSGALVMTSFGIAEFVGRVICAAFADKIKFSFAYVYAVSCGFMGVATLLAPLGTTLTVMFVYATCKYIVVEELILIHSPDVKALC